MEETERTWYRVIASSKEPQHTIFRCTSIVPGSIHHINPRGEDHHTTTATPAIMIHRQESKAHDNEHDHRRNGSIGTAVREYNIHNLQTFIKTASFMKRLSYPIGKKQPHCVIPVIRKGHAKDARPTCITQLSKLTINHSIRRTHS